MQSFKWLSRFHSFLFFTMGGGGTQTNSQSKGHLPQHVATAVKYHSPRKRATMTSLVTCICLGWNTIARPFHPGRDGHRQRKTTKRNQLRSGLWGSIFLMETFPLFSLSPLNFLRQVLFFFFYREGGSPTEETVRSSQKWRNDLRREMKSSANICFQ